MAVLRKIAPERRLQDEDAMSFARQFVGQDGAGDAGADDDGIVIS